MALILLVRLWMQPHSQNGNKPQDFLSCFFPQASPNEVANGTIWRYPVRAGAAVMGIASLVSIGASKRGRVRRDAESSRIRVVVGDKTQMGCELLKTALSRDRRLEVIALATSADQVIAVATEVNPQVVLLSSRLQDGAGAGVNCLRSLVAAMGSVRVILLFDDGGQNEIIEAFRGGAKGVFRRSESLHRLSKCIHAVNQGQIWASSADLNAAMQSLASAPSLQCVNVNGKKLLTPREQQVVGLVAEGLTNREISEQLHLREHTIKNYLFKIYDKLGVSSRVELIMYTMSHCAAT